VVEGAPAPSADGETTRDRTTAGVETGGRVGLLLEPLANGAPGTHEGSVVKVLVTFGSRRGGTEEIAHVVGEVLDDLGHDVDVRPANDVHGLRGWDVVVLGGALYAWRWQKDARRFVYRHADELRQRSVWAFSSGPLDESASQREIGPTWPVRRLLGRIGVQGHVTFGGRIAPDSPEADRFEVGDWRDMERVRSWAEMLARDVHALPGRRVVDAGMRAISRVRTLVVALCLFTGVTALAGGLELLIWPHGTGFVPLSLLERTPFHSFLVPGLVLFVVVGVGNFVSSVLEWRGYRHAAVAAFAAGLALVAMIVVELSMFVPPSWLHFVYFCIGVVTMIASAWLWWKRQTLSRPPETRGPVPGGAEGHPA